MNRLHLIFLMAGIAASVYCQAEDYNTDFRHSTLTVSISPSLGEYLYMVDINGGAEYDGGLNMLAVEYEYRMSYGFAVYAFLEVTGHLYDGHEDSSSFLGRYWGIGNPKIGAGIRVIYNVNRLELSLGTGVYYARYIQGSDDQWPGAGLSVNARAMFMFTESFGLGLTGMINISRYRGGPYPDNPYMERLPFLINEYNAAFSACWKF